MNNYDERMRKYLIALLILLATFCIIYYILLSEKFTSHFASSNKNDHSNSDNNEKTKAANVTCLAGIVFAQTSTGRLGNRLMEYASAWSLAKLYNLTPVVHDEIYERIKPLFPKLSVSPASRFLEELRERDPDCAQLAEKTFLRGDYTRIEEPLEAQVKRMKSNAPIVLQKYIVLAPTISPLQNELRKEFTYLPEFVSYAEKTLQKASRGLKISERGKKVLYVGVHVRRTDYPKFLTRKYGLNDDRYVDIDYYVRAVSYMLKRLSENASLKVVFAVTSDDMKWTKNNLIPELENYLKFKKLLGTNVTVSWCGSKDFQNDLVLLSSCNHSIISYGTFGTWSSLMSGGLTIAYDFDPKRKLQEEIITMKFVKLLPHWIAMP